MHFNDLALQKCKETLHSIYPPRIYIYLYINCLITFHIVAFSNEYFIAFELLIDKTKHPYRDILADGVLDIIFYDISLIRLSKLLSFLIAATDLKSNVTNLKV